ncbi:hypothetical protein AB0D34_40510 [Streptomyces sp. NPDC048420]|uniref:hypothetical protein n=1 Tax=Streptomyces sp. NPDC048420 TaxID=3155755 RepID=UPI00341B6EB6
MSRLSRGKPRSSSSALVVLGTLCALALTACGTERAGGGDMKAESAGRGGAVTSTPLPADSAAPSDTEGPDFLPFMELLVTLMEPCAKEELPPATDPSELAEELDSVAPPTDLPPEPPLPTDPLPTEETGDPVDPRKELELASVEKCEADIHDRRITKALTTTPATTPEQVRRTLHTLGYIDERIHGPELAANRVKFTLDLRLLGGSLCLDGVTADGRTTVEPYGASVEVECRDVRRLH